MRAAKVGPYANVTDDDAAESESNSSDDDPIDVVPNVDFDDDDE